MSWGNTAGRQADNRGYARTPSPVGVVGAARSGRFHTVACATHPGASTAAPWTRCSAYGSFPARASRTRRRATRKLPIQAGQTSTDETPHGTLFFRALPSWCSARCFHIGVATTPWIPLKLPLATASVNGLKDPLCGRPRPRNDLIPIDTLATVAAVHCRDHGRAYLVTPTFIDLKSVTLLRSYVKGWLAASAALLLARRAVAPDRVLPFRDTASIESRTSRITGWTPPPRRIPWS